MSNMKSLAVLGVVLCIAGVGFCKDCTDDINGKLDGIRPMIPLVIETKNVSFCATIRVTGVQAVKSTGACECGDSPGKTDCVDQKLQIGIENLTAVCEVGDLKALGEAFNIPIGGVADAASKAADVIGGWLGAKKEEPKPNCIHAHWQDFSISIDMTLDMNEGEVIPNAIDVVSSYLGLKIWCSGSTSWMTIAGPITKAQGIPSVIGGIVQVFTRGKLTDCVKENKDHLAQLACD